MSNTSMNKLLALVLATSAIAIVGCDKEVKLSFINTTSQTRDVRLTAPGQGMAFLGPLPGTGGRLTHKLKIDEDYLPARCSWQAGDRSDEFVITKDSKDKLSIIIDPTGNIGPIDKRTTVDKVDDINIEDIIVDQQMVVE